MRILDSDRTPQSRLSLGACLALALIALLVIPFSGVASTEVPAEKSPETVSDATFPAHDYTLKDGRYTWKQSLSGQVEDVKTVLCLSHDGDVAVKAHADAGKNTVEVQAVIVLTPGKSLANHPDAQKKILALKERVGVTLRKDDKKTPTPEDDTWTLQTVMPQKTPQDINVQISMDVLMPASLALKVTSEDGDTKVRGLAGPVEIKTADGDVSASNCLNSLSIRSADGDVSAANCAGPMDLTTADGDVKVQNCSKSMAIEAQDGDVTLKEVQAKIDVKVGDGDIKVSFARNPTEDCSVESRDGDVVMAMPKTSKVTLDLKAGEGDVHLDAPEFEGQHTDHAAMGKLNGGGPTLKSRSQGGDLSVRLE